LRIGLRVGTVSIFREDPERHHYQSPVTRLMIMTREEIEKSMDALARKYVETHDKKIIEELYELACELRKLEKKILTD